MFFFKRSPGTHLNFSNIGVDMHSHLIPGVDDGAKDVPESLLMIKGLQELGFSSLYTTPHTFQDFHPNTSETLNAGFALLNNLLPDGITLQLSSEYYLDPLFQEQLNMEKLMPLPGKRLLVEFSQISRPHDLEAVIFDLGIRGFQVVLAHPERYLFFHNHSKYYMRLKEMGVEFQVNALSLSNHYGKNIRAVAEKLIDQKMIDFIGTDIHRVQHLDLLKEIPGTKYYGKLLDSGLLKNNELMSS